MLEQVVICQTYFFIFLLHFHFFSKSVVNCYIAPKWILSFSNEDEALNKWSTSFLKYLKDAFYVISFCKYKVYTAGAQRNIMWN